jgi:Spy/CpxP family protein refolding chaperone
MVSSPFDRDMRAIGMKGLTILGAMALALQLAACDTGSEPPPADQTVFDDQVGTLDKAADVQRVTDEQAQKLRDAVEESEGD